MEGFTLKEMVKQVRDEQRSALVTQTSMLETLKGIDNHLDKLNSKVADHEERIHALKAEHTRVKGFAAGVSLVIGTVWTMFNFIVDK